MEGSTEIVNKWSDVDHHWSKWPLKGVAAQNNSIWEDKNCIFEDKNRARRYILLGVDHHRSKSRYKGVVSQDNGRWVAAIHTRGNKLWFRTFDHQDKGWNII